MNIPEYIAAPNDIAEVIGATVLPEKCPDCRVWNLFMKPEQGIPFCWGCVTDRKTAAEGRTRLLKAKLADRGIVIDHQPECAGRIYSTDEPDKRYWPGGEGSPL